MEKAENRKVIGGNEFPEFCYKVYEKEDYAKQFIHEGVFRMGCLLSYKDIEDESRRDPTEGSGHTKEPGIVTVGWVSPNSEKKTIWTKEQGYQEHHIESGNATFCFCTCLPEVDNAHMLKEFGKHIIKINDPKKLAEDINEYFIRNGQRFLVEGCRIIYNKGEKLDKELTQNERLDMPYKQKPARFTPDCEFRIIAINLGDPCPDECKYLGGQFELVEPKCKFIEINLNKPLHYCNIMYL